MASGFTLIISWPEHEDLWRTMPKCFQYSFGKKTTVIIDCFEVFIEKPSNFLAMAQTYSNYKSHNTIKVLIGISPQGTVTFVSQAWGGRTLDKSLTENCGLLNKLKPGDLVWPRGDLQFIKVFGFTKQSYLFQHLPRAKINWTLLTLRKLEGLQMLLESMLNVLLACYAKVYCSSRDTSN